MPESFSSPLAAARMRRLASLMASSRGSEGSSSLRTPVAIELATSPASKPPIPSATAKSVSSRPSPTSRESSLFLRTLPGSVMPWCSSRSTSRFAPLLRVPEGRGPHPHSITTPQEGGADGPTVVYVGAIGGASVLYVQGAAVPGESGMLPRDVVITLQDDVARGRTADARHTVRHPEPGVRRQDI